MRDCLTPNGPLWWLHTAPALTHSAGISGGGLRRFYHAQPCPTTAEGVSVVINLRSRKLLRLFNEVLERIPSQEDKALLSKRIMLVVDSADFIPFGTKPKWGAVINITFKKSLAIVYLSPRKLPSQPDSFVGYTISKLLAHVVLGHIDEIDCEERQDEFEKEADARVEAWSIPFVDRG